MPINVNLDKAKEIHKDYLRAARQPILEQLDVDYIRASEQGADTADIVAAKQELRDVTKHPDLATASTVEELKQVWPEVLGTNPLVGG